MTSRLGLLLAWAFLSACAHVEAPPGGPEDSIAPRIMVTRPESLTVVPGWTSPVVLLFDERISERGVEEAVMVSPRTSTVRIERGRDEIRVSLRGGWQPGTIYHVTVKPLIQDLFNNQLAKPVTIVFSTGPPIPATGVAGRVTDRITGKGELDLRVEAIRSPDSLVYSVPTDSAGGYAIPHMPSGSYQVRAFRDMNRNRALDPYEPRDSAQAEITASASAEVSLAIVPPDSTPPKLAGATPEGADRLELRFDDYLDPLQPLVPAAVQITDSAGTFVPVAGVSLDREGASAQAPDTARAAAADTGSRPRAPAPPPLPSQTLVVDLAEGAELAPGRTYRVRVRAVRNLVGLEAPAEAEFRGPPARAQPAAAPPAAPTSPGAPAPAPATPPPAPPARPR